MNIELIIATTEDAEALFDMQIKSFTPLLEKYEDYDTNPANEPIERLINRIERKNGIFYKILLDEVLVGGICIYWIEEHDYWISPMFILPEYQGKGIAQKSIKLLKSYYHSGAKVWKLATLLEEKGNCHLFEKLGYIRTGFSKSINQHATLIYYEKRRY